jgi:hypothetical protein
MQNENPTTWKVLLQPLPALKKVEKKISERSTQIA